MASPACPEVVVGPVCHGVRVPGTCASGYRGVVPCGEMPSCTWSSWPCHVGIGHAGDAITMLGSGDGKMARLRGLANRAS